jgi:hypothetical protein
MSTLRLASPKWGVATENRAYATLRSQSDRHPLFVAPPEAKCSPEPNPPGLSGN